MVPSIFTLSSFLNVASSTETREMGTGPELGNGVSCGRGGKGERAEIDMVGAQVLEVWVASAVVQGAIRTIG